MRNYNAAYVFKTDDDAFVNVAPLAAQLRALCESPGCLGPERLYLGKMVRHSDVLLQEGHRWNNEAYYQHTGAPEKLGCLSCLFCRWEAAERWRLPAVSSQRHHASGACA